jgi:L-asparaginase
LTASRDRETLERAEVAVVPVIATGGSIEARVEDGVKHVDDDIGASLSRAGETAGVQARVIRFARSPSFALSLEDMLRVAALARTQPPWPRTVVTCGTDLLEEMAFVLDLLAPPAGVVVTGASHDASPESDAAENLTGALLAATTDALAGGCAYVAFAERIRLGRDVIETAPPPDLFAGSAGTPVGRWTATGISVEYAAATLPFPRTEPTVRSALVVACHAALSIDHLDLVSPDVVVVEGFGAGNVPPTLAAALERRLAGGREVVLCSTASGLPVRRVSATAGGGVRLLDAGAVSAGTLRPRKAAVLAALLLGGGVERRAFEAVVAAISEPR